MRRNRGSVIFPIRGVTVPPKRLNSISNISLVPSANEVRNVSLSSIDPFTKHYMKIISDIADEDEDSMVDDQRLVRLYGISKSEAERASIFESIANFFSDTWKKIKQHRQARSERKAKVANAKQLQAKAAAAVAEVAREREEANQQRDTLMNLPIIDDYATEAMKIRTQKDKQTNTHEEEQFLADVGEYGEKVSEEIKKDQFLKGYKDTQKIPYDLIFRLASMTRQNIEKENLPSILYDDIEQYAGITVPFDFIKDHLNEILEERYKINQKLKIAETKLLDDETLSVKQRKDHIDKLTAEGYFDLCRFVADKWGVSQDRREQEQMMISSQLQSLRDNDPNPDKGNFPTKRLASLLYHIVRTRGITNPLERERIYNDLIPSFYDSLKTQWSSETGHDLDDITSLDVAKLIKLYQNPNKDSYDTKYFDYFFNESPTSPESKKGTLWIESIFRRYLADLMGDTTSMYGLQKDREIFKESLAGMRTSHNTRLIHLRQEIAKTGLDPDLVASQYVTDVINRFEQLLTGVVEQPQFFRGYKVPRQYIAQDQVRIPGNVIDLHPYDMNTLFFHTLPIIEAALRESYPQLFEKGNPFDFKKQRKTK